MLDTVARELNNIQVKFNIIAFSRIRSAARPALTSALIRGSGTGATLREKSVNASMPLAPVTSKPPVQHLAEIAQSICVELFPKGAY
jgi:hypothetical protein